MTAVEFDRLSNGTGPAHAHGWLVSLMCHVLGIGCAIVLMAEIEKPVLPDTFQWDVAVVEAPPPVQPSPAQPPPSPAEPRPMKPVAESQPLVKPVVPVQQTVQEVARTVEAVEPVRQTERVVESQPLVKPVVPVQQTVQEVAQTVEAVEPAQQVAREVVSQAETSTERPAAQSIESHAVTADQDAVVERRPSQVAVTSRMERAQPAEAPASIEAVPQARVSEPVERVSPSIEQEPRAVAHRVIQQRVVQHRETQADYGWLRDSLWRRIEELKRYPAQAKMNHWEGKVVVEAVIRDDGEVVALSIAESSGRVILDQEAMTVMKKASPLALKHPLGKPQITILVPISYRLDG